MDEWLGHPIKALFLFCLTILAVTLTAKEPIRTWTSADGRTLQAQYIESSAGKVTIKMGSREYTLPLSRFSQADQDYVAGVANQPPPAYQPITKAEPRDARKFYREEDDWEGYLLGGAIVIDFTGDVQIKAPTPEGTEERYGPDWADPKKEQVLTAGYQLRTREGSHIRLLLTNGTLITLSPVSEAKILTYFQETIPPSNRTFKETTEELSPSMVKLDLSLGEMIVETKKLNKSSSLDITTPVAAAGIRGTAFRLRASESEQALEVLRGQVDCQQGKGQVTSVIGGQANTASKGRIEDPEGLSDDAGGAIEQTLSSLGEQVGGLTIAQLSEKHEAANPPLRIEIQEDGFEAELRRMIRRPRGKILQEDYDRVGYVKASDGLNANIKDLRFVENLRNLTTLVILAQPISDLRPLVNCQKLDDIYFFSLKNISNIQVLANLPNLTKLWMDHMSHLKRPEQTLAKLKDLKELRLIAGTKLKDWSFIKNLNKLEKLMASPDADFPTISQLKTLKRLIVMCDEVSGNQLPELDQFKDFQHLERLEIYFLNTKRNISDNDLNQLRAMLPNTEVVVAGGN
jgi:hypothetical protein